MAAQVTNHVVESLAEGDFAHAIFLMDTMRIKHPRLRKAEQRARVRLASAIIAYDTASAADRVHRARYTDLLVAEYAQALADLLRGEYEEET